MPLSYPIGMVDTIFADVAQPDQARILALNAHNFLKNGGHFVISIKVNEKNSERLFNHEYGFIQASCIDSTAVPEAVFAGEVKKLQSEKLKPKEQLTLEPYERDHAVVVGVYRQAMESFLTNNRFQSIILDRSVKTQQKKKMKRKNPWTTNNTVVYKNIQQLSVGECFSVLPVICTVLLFLLLIIKKNNEDRFETKARETKSIHGLFFLQSFFFSFSRLLLIKTSRQ